MRSFHSTRCPRELTQTRLARGAAKEKFTVREGLDKKRRDKIRLNMYWWDIALIDMLRHHRR